MCRGMLQGLSPYPFIDTGLETGANIVIGLSRFAGLSVREIFHLRRSDCGRIFLRIKSGKVSEVYCGLKLKKEIPTI